MARTGEQPEGNDELGDQQAGDGTNGQSRGGLRPTRPTRSKKGRLKDGERLRGCKLSIPETVFERLRQTAIKRKTSMSLVAAGILDGKLPHFEVIESDRPPAAD
jgi:hypothetical protein